MFEYVTEKQEMILLSVICFIAAFCVGWTVVDLVGRFFI